MTIVCLNMIVRNERDVILHCLAAVRPFITHWLIHDTGSTDGTQKLIKKYLRDLPGSLRESKWVDFSHNRNLALEDAKALVKDQGYLLFVDADEVWQYAPTVKFPPLTKDVYYTTLRQLGSANAHRIALVRAALPWKWFGVLHEVITAVGHQTSGILPDIVNVCNLHQGARAKDVLTRFRDGALLAKALVSDPTNARYAYYAGVSYLAAGDLPKAEEFFCKRLDLSMEPIEETYQAMYYLAVTQEKAGRLGEALQHFLTAYELRPTRAEPLKHVASIHQRQHHPAMGLLVAQMGLALPYPTADNSVDYTIYEHQLLIEVMNCSLLTGKWRVGLDACQQLLQLKDLPVEYRAGVEKNLAMARGKIGGL